MPGGSLYFKNAAPSGAPTALSIQDGGTAPTAAITATGWTVAKLAIGNFSLMAAGTKRASTAFSTTDALATPAFSAASCWRSELPYTGSFNNGNWSIALSFRAVSAAASQSGRIKVRIWKSSTADGSGATELTTTMLVGGLTSTLTTTSSTQSIATWASPGVQTFNNEYLWIQCEWETRSVSSSNSADAVFYIESFAQITTPVFVTPPSYAQAHFRFRTDTGLADAAPTWAKAEDTPILAADYQAINYRLRLSVQNGGPGQPSNTWTLRYSRNGGAYTPITTTSSVVVAVDAGAGSSGDLCSVQRLTSAAGTFTNAGVYNESGTTGNVSLPAGQFTEFEFGIKVVTADVANNDTLDFQLFPNTTGVITQTVTPRITVAIAAGVSGAGALAATAAAIAGTGPSASVGTGALAGVAAAVSGSGTTAAAAISGTGALVAGSAAISGAGASASMAVGALNASSAALAGIGASAASGTSTLAAQGAAMAGTGVSASVATGALSAPPATVAGAATSASVGTGALAAASAGLAGTGSGVSIASGTGALASQPAALTGAGASASVGAGAFIAQSAVIAGAGVSQSVGAGALLAGAAEIAGSGAAIAAGDAEAPGALLSLSLTLEAGAASGAGQFPPIVIGGGVRAYSATAPGVQLDLWVSLQPGRAIGVAERQEHATARGAVLPFSARLVAGRATADAVGYDNDLMMLLAA